MWKVHVSQQIEDIALFSFRVIPVTASKEQGRDKNEREIERQWNGRSVDSLVVKNRRDKKGSCRILCEVMHGLYRSRDPNQWRGRTR